jgi:hypothetical protein
MGMLDEEKDQLRGLKKKNLRWKPKASCFSKTKTSRACGSELVMQNSKGKNDPTAKGNNNTATPTPAPKAKAVQKNNTANVIAGRQARGLSMLEAQNKRRDRQGKVVRCRRCKLWVHRCRW